MRLGPGRHAITGIKARHPAGQENPQGGTPPSRVRYLQLPPMHRWVAVQTIPHAPQLLTFVVVFTQAVPQSVNVPVHWHLPVTQLLLVGQTVPQSPQFCVLVCKFTQTSPHAVRLELQTQLPSVHVCPEEQTVPQVPQLAVSVLTLTQAPPQSVSVAAQAVTHTPALHA
jgi:hypothetical protein